MLINLRNALMTGKRLPYDAEVEFLESTGTQWIDTGFKANTTTTLFECGIVPLNTSSTQGVFGSRNTANYANDDANNVFMLNGALRLDWLDGQRTGGGQTYPVSLGEDYSISITRGTATVNGTTLTSSNRVSINSSYNFLIGNFTNGSAGAFTTGFIGRWKFAKLYSNGTLVRDYIPVRKGTVGYLYDRVSGALFGNAGTGDFVLGPDVVPVEWMEGGQLDSGIAFIDTGYAPNSSTKIESTSAILSAGGYSGRYGNRSRLTFGVSNGILYMAQGDHYSLGGYTAGTFYSFVNDIPNRTVSVEGVGSTSTTAVSNWYPQLYPIYLFASNVAPNVEATVVNNKRLDTNSFGRIRMKSCNIWENDIPVRKFRPVRVGTEGAMMDVLTRRIYRNAGSGAFTYGNDLKYPIPSE